MTGQIAFARTIRALDADDFRSSKIALFLALAILACWIWWAIAAAVPQYEVSNSVHIEPDRNTATADFSSPSRILPGQHAQIASSNGQIVEAQVANVQNEPTGPIRVQLNLIPTVPATRYQLPATWRVNVEVARVSPAAIVLRALR